MSDSAVIPIHETAEVPPAAAEGRARAALRARWRRDPFFRLGVALVAPT
jgi:hypothetical protein